jgi:hypothetical protein
MRTQQDSRLRVVALDNLRAMCEHASGRAHTFQVSKVTRSRVHVTYSNPDEYGNAQPVTAVFPCYPSGWPDDAEDNPRVVLDAVRVIGDDSQGAAYPAIDADIICGPTLWRTNPTANDWRTHRQIVKDGTNSAPSGKCTSCTICDAEVK